MSAGLERTPQTQYWEMQFYHVYRKRIWRSVDWASEIIDNENTPNALAYNDGETWSAGDKFRVIGLYTWIDIDY